MERSLGTHCIVEMYGCDVSVLRDEQLVTAAIGVAAAKAHATLLNVTMRPVESGIIALALLSESHISIHSYNTGCVMVDVFTCGAHTKPELACEHLVSVFRPTKHVFKKFLRGDAAYLNEG